jgi:hypothetical protein
LSEPKPIPPINPNRVEINAAEIGFTLMDDGADDAGVDGSVDGWIYVGSPEGGDCRKFVTLEQDGMMWVGIRAYNHQGRFWQNNNEPERATVIAWRDLPAPARGRWDRGRFHLRPL